ncbi:MAG: 23S rRNA (adenine(2503)-C(2))-methyltransferase RlmN [Rhodobiaceae bacterium]|jgi:23S rRNA (adenine2503-C2)-methyltransferase|nr:23S rRNA (adenine(2503)-C(2))-methyltransferase RlmN [Rhodobiaceae bacterium]MBT5518381.1 23S rRNA (adenine(2503)-C(2))-methyltransferase RlmN [Rhodobiaceae bacterium]MBT7279720.1 23S rRNA (adenine(2503)-C(2))-methyltransferase RlmN [Rhodobiaceae bacterium]MDG2495799.1 23S rRNA (adenine(2503)-C(2))-methyltransferase RlmN [Alphaproteobacteria bacterium]
MDDPVDETVQKTSLIGLSREQLRAALVHAGVPEKQLRMRTNQLWSWIYARGATQWEAMSDVSKGLRTTLSEAYTLDRLEVADAQFSDDGTRKYLFRLADGQLVETVYIPEVGRGTLCVSSQVGCTLTCRFCHTGTQKLVRNLTIAEIVGQMVAVRDDLQDWGDDGLSNSGRRKITNVVMMGMGEPLYNSDNVGEALNVISDGEGLSLSRRRITLSTSGVVPEIPLIGEKTGVMLAISLHAVRDDLRNELVPLNKKYPIAALLEACRQWPGLSNAKRITFEYVMLKGVNDSDADARDLVRLLAGIPAKINLIPFNPWPGAPYECSQWERIEAFAEIVNRAGYASPVRSPRGRDIMAACGQLKSASVKETAASKKIAELQARNLGRG